MPEISIIVPVYNVENYLRQCLDSLINQTISDYEVICLNDGSTDSSLSILKEYEANYPHVRLIDKENEGYGKTMNRGFSEARAPYIGIVESDDYVKPEMFEKLYGAMTAHQADLVKCNFYKFTMEDGENIDYSHEYPDEIYGKAVEPIDHPEIYAAHSSVWAALYDKKFLTDNHIRFNETPGASFQDISFHFKALSSARKMVVIKDALLYYRTDNLMSSVNSPYKIYCICDEIHEAENYIREQDKERQKKLWPILMKRKYYDYRWNRGRLATVFQFAFYEKMVAELREDKLAGRFENIDWISPGDEAEFGKMLDNPFGYFMSTVREYHDNRIGMADTKNGEMARWGFFSMMEKADEIILYGAGKIGQRVAKGLEASGISREKLMFAVTDTEGMEKDVNGIPVRQIDEMIKEGGDRLVLVAVKGEKQIEMLNRLKYLGCGNVLLADNEVLSYLG